MLRALVHRRLVLGVLLAAVAAGNVSARELRPSRAEAVRLQVQDSVVPGEEAVTDDILIDQAYQHLKLIGAESEALERPFAALVSAARQGIVDEAAVYAVITLYADPQVQAKAEAVSHGLAEALAYGQVPRELIDIMPALDVHRTRAAEQNLGALSVEGDALAPELRNEMPRPALSGVCLACPSFNFGPFTPTTTCASHSSSTSSSGDCNTYLFNVTPGRLYEFSTCSTLGACGSGAFDTVIEVRQQNACGTIVASNDDNCGLQSRVTYCVPFGVSQLSVKVRGFSTTFGSYALSYRDAGACTACFSCGFPKYTATPNPDATCRRVNGTLTTCQDEYYQFNLTAGQTYDFSTCNSLPPACPAIGNTLDTVIEAWSPTCVLTASNDDAVGCSNLRGSHLILTPSVSGLWKIRVRGFGSSTTGPYNLAYQQRVGCQSPSVASLTPTTSSTNTTNCQRTQAFAANVNLGSGPITVNFVVTPGPGNSASPTTGSVVLASAGTATFTTTLTKGSCSAGNFTVTATATNSCGSNARTITHVLSDTTAPVLSPSCVSQTTTVACDAAIPAPVPRTATDNCDPAPTVTFTETRTNLTCPANYNLVRRWTGRDCRPNQTICTQTIQVRDTVGPTIVAPDAGKCVHPPNHEYKCYSTSIFMPTTVDNCSAVTGIVVTGCSSNEPDEGTGDGDFPNDCLVSPNGTEVCVRAERAGSENDRIYTLLGRARDACGNLGPQGPVAAIRVPHDDSEHPECDPADSGLSKRF